MYMKIICIVLAIIAIVLLSLELNRQLKMTVVNSSLVNRLYIALAAVVLILVCQLYCLYDHMMKNN